MNDAMACADVTSSVYMSESMEVDLQTDEEQEVALNPPAIPLAAVAVPAMSHMALTHLWFWQREAMIFVPFPLEDCCRLEQVLAGGDATCLVPLCIPSGRRYQYARQWTHPLYRKVFGDVTADPHAFSMYQYMVDGAVYLVRLSSMELLVETLPVTQTSVRTTHPDTANTFDDIATEDTTVSGWSPCGRGARVLGKVVRRQVDQTDILQILAESEQRAVAFDLQNVHHSSPDKADVLDELEQEQHPVVPPPMAMSRGRGRGWRGRGRVRGKRRGGMRKSALPAVPREMVPPEFAGAKSRGPSDLQAPAGDETETEDEPDLPMTPKGQRSVAVPFPAHSSSSFVKDVSEHEHASPDSPPMPLSRGLLKSPFPLPNKP